MIVRLFDELPMGVIDAAILNTEAQSHREAQRDFLVVKLCVNMHQRFELPKTLKFSGKLCASASLR